MKNIFIVIFIFLYSLCQSQDERFILPNESKTQIDPNNFNYGLLEEVVLIKINKIRFENGQDLFKEKKLLKQAAYDQAGYMSDYDIMQQDDPGARLVLYGGTRNAEEIIARCVVNKGDRYLTYEETGEYFVNKWYKTKKANDMITDDFYLYIGISATINADGNKCYIAAMFGNNSSFALELGEETEKYISQKSFGVESYDSKICKKCSKYGELLDLQKGLYVEDNEIYFKYDDFRLLKKILKDPYDGLAIDIVQKAQFGCESINYLNYNLPNKGLIQKYVPIEKIEKKNRIDNEKLNQVDVKLADLPEDLEGDYELNLIVVIDRKACKNLTQTYVEYPILKNDYEFEVKIISDPLDKYEDGVPKIKEVDKFYLKQLERKYLSDRYCNAYVCYNYIMCYIYNNSIESTKGVYPLYNAFNKLQSFNTFSADSLILIEGFIHMTIQNSNSAEDIKLESIDKLKDLEISTLSKNNLLSLARLYMKVDDKLKALEILDEIILNDDISEDLLFSYITISSLYYERYNSGFFNKVLKKAIVRNQERTCDLFSGDKLSFQVFENPKVKELICNTCK